MIRTTDAAVKDLIATTLNTMPFIRTAALYVDTVLAPVGLSVELLTEIECWLAAHFVAIRTPAVTRKTLGETTVSYAQGPLGKGLESTSYGQTAMALDPTGTLAAHNTGKKSAVIQVF